MTCTITIRSRVEKKLKDLTSNLRERVEETLRELSKNPLIGEKLKGQLSGLRKMYVGRKYRVVYKLDSCHILVIDIDSRERIYEKLKRGFR